MGNRFMKRFLSQLAELYAEGSHMARLALLHLRGARGVNAGEVNACCSRTSAQLVPTVC
jgi:hypothetical protein